jgi:hypothetical protein
MEIGLAISLVDREAGITASPRCSNGKRPIVWCHNTGSCSRGVEIGSDDGERLRVVFALDRRDREVMS